jgi:hypothetical protein
MIGVLLIASGGDRYTNYIPELFSSLRKFFPPHEVILFTNNGDIRHHMTEVPIDNLGWPAASLKRYHIFLKHRNLLENFSHVFYMDIDMRVNSPIEASEICGDGLTAVLHPGFVGYDYKAYCRDSRSTAYIGGNSGQYYQGCFQGGRTKDYLDTAEILCHHINVDDAAGVTAEWFDEAHWNWYLYHNPPAIALSPIFAYPQKDESYPAVQGQVPKIIHLEKWNQEAWK